jgi:hypothetical protein
MSLHCNCPDWEPQIAKINGPISLQSVRSGGAYQYDGKQFVFCPWCGSRLKLRCHQCNAILEPGEQYEGHFFYGGCHRPAPVPVRPRPEPETNKCRTCGKPTFGLYCAEHSPFKSRV